MYVERGMRGVDVNVQMEARASGDWWTFNFGGRLTVTLPFLLGTTQRTATGQLVGTPKRNSRFGYAHLGLANLHPRSGLTHVG